jgi:hypothetical protein
MGTACGIGIVCAGEEVRQEPVSQFPVKGKRRTQIAARLRISHCTTQVIMRTSITALAVAERIASENNGTLFLRNASSLSVGSGKHRRCRREL